MKATRTAAKFPSGILVMTAGVNEEVAMSSGFAAFVVHCVGRHMGGDWGDMDAADKASNDAALATGDGRLFSAYEHPTLPKVWIITEGDRSATTVLFPSEY